MVGENVQIEDSYIWGNVTIQEGCTITGCVIANDVTIKAKCVIGSNCLISRGITIGPDVSLPIGTRLIKQLEAMQGELSDDSTPTCLEQSLSQELINLGNESLVQQYIRLHTTTNVHTCLLLVNTKPGAY